MKPIYAAETHLDGSMTVPVPRTVQQGTPDEIYRRFTASGPKDDLGRSPDVIGTNTVPIFEDPEMTSGLGDLTAFFFVCHNDQTRKDCGQTSLLPGAHHEVEKFFRQQYETSGHVGTEGPGWPKLNHDVPNRCGQIYLSDAVTVKFLDETSECTSDRKKRPRPTPILMEPVSACIPVFPR